MSTEIYPWQAEFLAKAFDWAEKAPENTNLALYVDKIPVLMDGDVIGYIVTGDDMHYVEKGGE